LTSFSSTEVLKQKSAVAVYSFKQNFDVDVSKHTKNFNHGTCMKTFMNRILSAVLRNCPKIGTEVDNTL
jgi:6-phosphogluconate dehydrogenase (decarboxylating)